MSDEPKTGAVLELSRAAEQISQALTAHADAPTEATEAAVQAAFSAYVTALGSNTTAMIAGGLGLVFKKLDALTVRTSDHIELIDHRFRAYNVELDEYREQHKAMLALVEERLIGPFGEMVQRVETLEYGYAELAQRLDTALDPASPGATVEMVAVHRRVEMLTRWLIVTLALLFITLILLIWHHYYIYARLG